jgi:hypothetical protein
VGAYDQEEDSEIDLFMTDEDETDMESTEEEELENDSGDDSLQ